MILFIFILLLFQNSLNSSTFYFGENSFSINFISLKQPFSVDIEKSSSFFYENLKATSTFNDKINLKGSSKSSNLSFNFNLSYIDWVFSFRGFLPYREEIYYNNALILDENIYGAGLGVYKIIEGDGIFSPQISISSDLSFFTSQNFKKIVFDLNFNLLKKLKRIPFYLSFSYPTVFYFLKDEEWFKGNVSFFLLEGGFKILKKDFSLSLSSGFGINNNVFRFSVSRFL